MSIEAIQAQLDRDAGLLVPMAAPEVAAKMLAAKVKFGLSLSAPPHKAQTPLGARPEEAAPSSACARLGDDRGLCKSGRQTSNIVESGG